VFFDIIKRKIISVREIAADKAVALTYQAPDLSELVKLEKKWKEKKSQKSEVRSENLQTDTNLTSNLSDLKFSHLHNHSQFSVLQSVSDVGDLVRKASDYNMPALALTDHGNMYATFLFWQAIEKQNKSIKAYNEAIDKGEKTGEKKNELKCLIGCELFVNKDHKDKTKQDNGYSIPFLAKNKKGYENLSKLSSIGFTEGMYYVPRIDKNVLLHYKSDLICFTGSLQGEIPSLILNVGEEQAEEAFLWYKEQFGDDFYVELNRHNLPEEDHVNEVLLGFAKKHGVKYFAANNNYYLEKKSAYSRDILISVKEGLNFSNASELKELKNNSRVGRLFFPNDEFYFKSPQEMVKAFKDLPEAIECTNEIVSKIESFKLGRDVLLPKFKIPEEFLDPRDNDPTDEGKGNRGENAYLKHLTYEGAKKKYPNMTPQIKERLDFELSVMERMGFPGYFLIVSDFTTEARRLGVSVGPGRGSAAGSA